MMSWLRQHRDALRTALRRLLDAPLNAFLGALVLGIVLALPATGEMLIQNFLTLAGLVSTRPQVSLFMNVDAPEASVRKVEELLRQNTAVERSRYVPKAEALARLKKNEGLAEAIDSLPRNPLPDAFVVLPRSEVPSRIESLRSELAALPQVAQAQLDSAWVKRLDALVQAGRSTLLVLALFLGIALLAVSFNTIRLQILTQQDEIEVSRLLGASDTFIRRPFYYAGLIQGLLGGAIAWGLVWGATLALRTPLGTLASAYNLNLSLRALPGDEVLVLFCASALLGWAGTWLSVRRFLRD